MNFKQGIINTFSLHSNWSKEVSRFKWYTMKFVYLITFLGLGFDVWSEIFTPSEVWGTYDGITYSFWAAYTALMAIGLRYPIKMLPLLLLQLFYKSVWLLGIYLPLRLSGQLDESSEGFLYPFAMAIPIDLVAIPWGYLFKNYIKSFFKFSQYR